MKAMILAAGKGTRMGSLTAKTPKPLLQVQGKALIRYQLEALQRAGFREIVINTARFGDQIEATLGDGSDLGLHLCYSHEGEEPLETGGGIYKALELLSPGPFAIVNGDVFTDLDYKHLHQEPDGLAHLVLVNNPDHNPEGDFALEGNRVHLNGKERFTYSGIAVLRPELFAESGPGRFSLAPLLRHAATQNMVSGAVHQGYWLDVGTPQRLRTLDRRLARQ